MASPLPLSHDIRPAPDISYELRPVGQKPPGPTRDSISGRRSAPGVSVPSEHQSAYDLMVAMLRDWGLESLAPEVLRLLQEGRTLDQVSLLLQDTEAYKQRFQGNELRRKAGMPVLSPREYLQVEAAYRQILESAGLPRGFYDAPSDFASWIGSDVSPSEIGSRVNEAQTALDDYERNNPGTLWAFRNFYGITQENLVAHFLDRQRWDLNQLRQISRGARIAGAGYEEGIQLTRERAERLALSTIVSDAEIVPSIGRVATLTEDIGKLGSLYGEGYGATEAADEVFFGDESARRKRQRLTGREAAEFGGSSGVGRSSLSQAPGSY